MATGNVATNDITGKYIKSRPSTKGWNENYDRVFSKKTAAEWAELDSIEGEYDDTNPISYREFLDYERAYEL